MRWLKRKRKKRKKIVVRDIEVFVDLAKLSRESHYYMRKGFSDEMDEYFKSVITLVKYVEESERLRISECNTQ